MDKIYSISSLGRLAYQLVNGSSELKTSFCSWLLKESQGICDLEWAEATYNIHAHCRTEVLSEWEDAAKKCGQQTAKELFISLVSNAHADVDLHQRFINAVKEYRIAHLVLAKITQRGFFGVLCHLPEYLRAWRNKKNANKFFTLREIIDVACSIFGKATLQEMAKAL